MSKNLPPIDISNNPDLLRIVEEMKVTKTPRLLKKDRENVAVLLPLDAKTPRKKREKTPADFEAFKSAAGAFRGLIDADKLLTDIYQDREKTNRRPPRKL